MAEYFEDDSPDELNVVFYGDRIGKLLKGRALPIECPGIISFEINEIPVKRQINALEKLRLGENGVTGGLIIEKWVIYYIQFKHI
ncbi:hypothetical protein ABHI18_003516 [Aspergillus niger]|jgi:hypothetical protein